MVAGEPPPEDPALDSPHASRLRRTLHRAGLLRNSRRLRSLARLTEYLPTTGNVLRIFHSGDRLFAHMLRDIENARTRISMEMYMIQHDRTGRRFARALCERARAGVAVRIIYDAIGCIGTSRRFFQQFRDAGIELLEFHPVAPWRKRFAIFRRNHRKNLVIDGRIGYTGGVNIGHQWAGHRRGGAAWRDTHVRVEGPAAGDLEILFQETWFTETGRLLRLESTIPREPAAIGPGERHSEVYVVSGRGGPARRIRRLYLIAIGSARRRISITSSYFIPDRGLRRAIYRARARGVEVRLLLPQASDVPVADLAGRVFFGPLLRRGVKIHLWVPSVLHAKVVVIDGLWCTVGSSNLDHLSFTLNLEANLAIIDEEAGRALEERFEKDLRWAKPVTLAAWERRSWYERLKEQTAHLFRGFL